MDVSAKKTKIWRKDIEGRNGTFYKYSVSVSRKNEEGNYINAYIPVVFSRKSNAPDVISNGAMCDFEGFMSVESYTDKNGNTINNPQIVIMKAYFEEDSFAEAEEDIPF